MQISFQKIIGLAFFVGTLVFHYSASLQHKYVYGAGCGTTTGMQFAPSSVEDFALLFTEGLLLTVGFYFLVRGKNMPNYFKLITKK